MLMTATVIACNSSEVGILEMPPTFHCERLHHLSRLAVHAARNWQSPRPPSGGAPAARRFRVSRTGLTAAPRPEWVSD